MTARVLVIEHESDDPIHLMGAWQPDSQIVPCRPYDGDPVPTSLEGYDALVVMGGVMGANDDEVAPWLPATRELIRLAATTQVPTLGICLGHQLATVALGGEVRRNPAGRQFGLVEVGWTDEAHSDPLFGGLTRSGRGMHFNDDIVVRLPDGARRLATAPNGEVQAARLADTVWGVQWHPEVDEPLVRSWTDSYLPGELPEVTQVLADVAAAREELESSWRPLAVRLSELADDERARV